MSSKLLINESPLVLLPSLAKLIGLNEAIVLQQVQYWIALNERAGRNLHDGKVWVENSIEEWRESNFPWWSVSTIKRVIKNLEKSRLLIKRELSENSWDRTLSYTIDYERLEEMLRDQQEEERDDLDNNDADLPETSEPHDQVNLNHSAVSEWPTDLLDRDYTETNTSLTAGSIKNTMYTERDDRKKTDTKTDTSAPARATRTEKQARSGGGDPPAVVEMVKQLGKVAREPLDARNLDKFREVAGWIVDRGWEPRHLRKVFGDEGWWYRESFGKKSGQKPYLTNIRNSMEEGVQATTIVFRDV